MTWVDPGQIAVNRLAVPNCHSDPERSEGEESHDAQDRLREESGPFASAQGDIINNLSTKLFSARREEQ